MAKEAYPGEMRTRINVQERGVETITGGFQREGWVDVFPPGTVVRCKWVNMHGDEVITISSARSKETATLTLRYSPKITNQCRIWREDDTRPYEVISVDNIQGARKWLEVTVERAVSA